MEEKNKPDQETSSTEQQSDAQASANLSAEDRKADSKSVMAATHDTDEATPVAPPHFDASQARERTRE